ncbi:DNA topoisomerase IV subunit B, partial [Streptococcus anginosus]|nr:DNA topoisomerase IV subunit B [Streptococcus anginosus]
QQEYSRGHIVSDLKVVGQSDKTGTVVNFVADPEIFTDTTDYDFQTLNKRVRELAFLNKGLHITLEDRREEDSQEVAYQYEGGIKEYVQYLNENKEILFEEPVDLEGQMDDIEVEVAFQYTAGYHSNFMSFA